MNDAISALLDKTAIREVVERYCRGIDRCDAELVNGVYWPEATDDHGIYRGPGQDFAAFVIPFLREHYRCTMHKLGQSLVELDSATRARSESYFVAYHVGRQDARRLDVAAGRYIDQFEKRNGEWRLADRIVIIEWSDTQALAEPFFNPEDFVAARRDRNDAAYGVPARR